MSCPETEFTENSLNIFYNQTEIKENMIKDVKANCSHAQRIIFKKNILLRYCQYCVTNQTIKQSNEVIK